MRIRLLPAVIAGTMLTTACDFQATLSKVSDENSTIDAKATDRLKFFIHGKKTSNLSEDRRSITLSLEASDPDGGQLKIEWEQDKEFGTFNTTRGANVQWTANREGTYTMAIKVTVTGSKKTDDPDVAYFLLPVVDGKINATEIAPEITVAPQSLVLFRPLPSSLSLSADALSNLGVKTKAQLTATTYIYDSKSNTKVKRSGDFNELKWASGDPSIVTVDDNGYVRPADGSGIGMTNVTASSKTNSSSSANAQISVQYLDTAITLAYPTSTIYLSGQGSPNSVTIGATVKYSNPTDRGRIIFTDQNGREISWSSSNPSIAQVDANGKVTSLADASSGDVVITGTSNYDPSKSASVTVRVRGNGATNVDLIAQ
jgi:hypothetical protein